MLKFPYTATLLCCLFTGCTSPHKPSERSATITARPQFTTYKYYSEATLKTHGKKYSLIWPDEAPSPNVFNPNKDYIFEIYIIKSWVSLGSPDTAEITYTPELVRVFQSDQVFYDASICKVHFAPMHRKLVEIRYGLPYQDEQFFSALAKHFPNIGLCFGGCMPDPVDKQAFAWICPVCESNAKKWKTLHPNSPYSD